MFLFNSFKRMRNNAAVVAAKDFSDWFTSRTPRAILNDATLKALSKKKSVKIKLPDGTFATITNDNKN